MSSAANTRYQDIAETTSDLPWADLIAIDLSKFDEPGGKQELAIQLKHAISTVGLYADDGPNLRFAGCPLTMLTLMPAFTSLTSASRKRKSMSSSK